MPSSSQCRQDDELVDNSAYYSPIITQTSSSSTQRLTELITSYGSCHSLTTGSAQHSLGDSGSRATSPTYLLLSSYSYLTTTSHEQNQNNIEIDTDNNNNPLIEGGDNTNYIVQHYSDNNTSSSGENSTAPAAATTIDKMSLFNRLLNQTTLADKLLHPYAILLLLSQNGKYTALAFISIYALLTLLFILPLYLLSCIITEVGVYIFLLTSIIYGGRCLLRLLAFPGTNIKVYGEIECEFDKYSNKMLGSGCEAIIDFCMALRAGGASSSSSSSISSTQQQLKSQRILGGQEQQQQNDMNNGWDVIDVPATYNRVQIYKKRVFGTYYEVLHCLLEDCGQGGQSTVDAHEDRNGFYNRLGENISSCTESCKRINFCCDRQSSNSTVVVDGIVDGVIQMDISSLAPAVNRSPTNNNTSGESKTATTKNGNNPLMGDIGNMGNLTQQARADGRELFNLLSLLLDELSLLESSASNTISVTNQNQLKKGVTSDKSMNHATTLIARAEELREFLSRIKLSTSSDSTSEEDDMQQTEDESTSEDVGAEAVRRLEESSSSSVIGMVKSAVQAFVSMIDPPPHKVRYWSYCFSLWSWDE